MPVFGLALHRGIQVKFQKSLGEKETLQEVPNNGGRTSLCMLLVRISTCALCFFIFSPFRKFGMVEELACVSARRHVGFRDLKCQITVREV